MMPLNFVRIPLLFISGVYSPIRELPTWMQVVSMLSPLTHTVELARYASGGETFFGPFLNTVILTIYAAAFLFIGIRFHIMNQRKE
jgi:ABC-2 type transport system permease protein